MWAGVQKVSRPMDLCHETSQCAPMVTEVTAKVEHHKYQGMFDIRSAVGDNGLTAVAIFDLS
jgi:hypothetical protein